MKIGFCGTITLVLLLYSSIASSMPIEWNLSNVGFADTTNATGSFVFDQSTTTFSKINITTSSGAMHPGAIYDELNPNYGPNINDFVFLPTVVGDLTGVPALVFQSIQSIGTLLSDLGTPGTLTIFAINEWFCGNSSCTQVASPSRYAFNATLIGEAINVPEPASITLIGIGLFGFSLTRKRRGQALRLNSRKEQGITFL